MMNKRDAKVWENLRDAGLDCHIYNRGLSINIDGSEHYVHLLYEDKQTLKSIMNCLIFSQKHGIEDVIIIFFNNLEVHVWLFTEKCVFNFLTSTEKYSHELRNILAVGKMDETTVLEVLEMYIEEFVKTDEPYYHEKFNILYKFMRMHKFEGDLLGKAFQNLMRYDDKKTMSAFYTNFVAADILANMCFNSWKDSVIDPACGSGTLLLSSIRRLIEIYEEERDEKPDASFIAERVYGIDKMITAAKLASLNLSIFTNNMKIACMDSLHLANVLHSRGTVEFSSIIGKNFKFSKMDVVLMNPPFGDREKMSHGERKKLSENRVLADICGNKIDLWGYFLALSHLMLKDNGVLGAVIPINFARGKSTERIRKFILENYFIKYIVKPVADISMSIDANFKDIILVAEKRKPKESDATFIIFIKKKLSECKYDYVVKMHPEYVDTQSIPYREIVKSRDNLMPFLFGNKIENVKIIREFREIYTSLPRVGPFSNIIKDYEILEGFGPRPKGISEILFIVNPISKSRLKRNVLLLKEGDKIIFNGKAINIKDVNKLRSLKSITSHKKMDISDMEDFIIIKNYEFLDEVLKSSRFASKKINWRTIEKACRGRLSYIALAHRLNIYSRNTHLFSVISSNKFVPTNAFHTFPHLSFEDSCILCLYFNSLPWIIEFLLSMKETQGTYSEIKQSDIMTNFSINIKTLNHSERKKLINTFESLKKFKFPSLLEQFEMQIPERMILDKAILNVMGMRDYEIDLYLPKIYTAIYDELSAMKRSS